MKKLNKKGFTLVELLAVIVILGVLLLIAVPATNKLIEKSKKDSFKKSLELVANNILNYKAIYPELGNKGCIYFFGPNGDYDKDLEGISGIFYIDKDWNVYLLHARKHKEYVAGMKIDDNVSDGIEDLENKLWTGFKVGTEDQSAIQRKVITNFVTNSTEVVKLEKINELVVSKASGVSVLNMTDFVGNSGQYINFKCKF